MISPDHSGSRRMIASVQRAINVLNLFDHQRIELGITDIARALDLPKSTVSGLVHTLEANHLLTNNSSTHKYRLGTKLLEYSGILLYQIDLRAVALPYLENLLEWCNESANLAVWNDDHVIYIERLLGTNLLGMRSEIGKREPIHSTALGKAILSQLDEGELQGVIKKIDLVSKTPYTITNQADLLADIQTSRKRGYALDNEENELGGRCVAAPIFDYRNKPIAALSISAPVQRFPEEYIPAYGKKVREVASAISRHLGYLSGYQS